MVGRIFIMSLGLKGLKQNFWNSWKKFWTVLRKWIVSHLRSTVSFSTLYYPQVFKIQKENSTFWSALKAKEYLCTLYYWVHDCVVLCCVCYLHYGVQKQYLTTYIFSHLEKSSTRIQDTLHPAHKCPLGLHLTFFTHNWKQEIIYFFSSNNWQQTHTCRRRSWQIPHTQFIVHTVLNLHTICNHTLRRTYHHPAYNSPSLNKSHHFLHQESWFSIWRENASEGQ